MRELYKNLGKVGISLEGNHNIELSYKEKSIVYDEISNRSYVSKKEVPIGIELSNIEYWQLLIKSDSEQSTIGKYTQLSSIRPIVDGIIEDAEIKENNIELSSENPDLEEGVFWITLKQSFAYKHQGNYYNNWSGVTNRNSNNYITKDLLPKQNIYIYNNDYYFVTYIIDELLNRYIKTFDKFEIPEKTYIKILN